MYARHGSASTLVPDLPVVLRDIAEALLADDWYRMCTADEAHKYYVVRAADQAVEINREGDFNMEFPMPTKLSPFSECVVRSQLADNKAKNFLAGARKRLQEAGIAPSAIDRFLAGDDDDMNDWKFRKDVSRDERVRLLTNFFQAATLATSGAHTVQLDADDAAEAKIAREKICLREVAVKYGKIVDKWEQLDPLPFDDPQVEEASKAYLYGFYRSSVVVSASALERYLKRAAGGRNTRELNYSDLVTDAAHRLGMGWAWIEQAKRVFWFRHRVVHDGHAPTHDEAGEGLSNVRSLVTQILSAQARA